METNSMSSIEKEVCKYLSLWGYDYGHDYLDFDERCIMLNLITQGLTTLRVAEVLAKRRYNNDIIKMMRNNK